MFHLINQEEWPRKDHFQYYTNFLKCGYTVTVRIDVTNLYQQVKQYQLKFYPAFIYCAAKVVNEENRI